MSEADVRRAVLLEMAEMLDFEADRKDHDAICADDEMEVAEYRAAEATLRRIAKRVRMMAEGEQADG